VAADVPSREALRVNILKHIGRMEMPGKYVAVGRIVNMLYRLSDAEYEGLIRSLLAFDPANIDPIAKDKLIADFSKNDDTGTLKAVAEAVFKSPELMNAAKELLTEVISGHGE
jgi:hypothetical protein